MSSSIGAREVAALASISARAVEKALARAACDPRYLWRGARLLVDVRHGRGGQAGRQYLVRTDSLPLELQLRWKEHSSALQRPLKHDAASDAERAWWSAVLGPALRHPRGSAERVAAVRDIVRRQHIRDGALVTVPERTVQRKLKAFDETGFAGLTRRKRIDAGERVAAVTRAWDRGVPFDDATKERVRETLIDYVRGLHKAGESPSILALHAARKLGELTIAAGFDPGREALAQLCRVPRHLIDAERTYRKVHIFNTDRKTHEDRRPRIKRTRDGLEPMDIVVGDVHPVDVCYRRVDGSIGYVKAIAWLDLATNRLFATFHFFEKGEGAVRNSDVIESFARMVAAWGAPRALYLDNGSEYLWADFIGDALRLLSGAGGYVGTGQRLIGDVAGWAERRNAVMRARAYNAPAKPIEGIFGVLEKKHFHVIPGHTGGDRMRKKSAHHGRAPEPFPGSIDQLRMLLENCITVYNALPQLGSTLKGRSPDDAFRAAVVSGWAMTAVDPNALRIAFATERHGVRVRQGSIQYKGRSWTSPSETRELQSYQGDTVTVLAPKYETWDCLPVRLGDGQLVFLEPERAFAFNDPAGAIESDARAKAHRGAVKALDRSAPSIDILAEREALAASLPPIPKAPVGARLLPSGEGSEIAAMIGAPAERERRKVQKLTEADEARRAERDDWFEIGRSFARPVQGGRR